MTADTLTVTDNRTGTSYEIPIENGAINAFHLRQIKESEGDFGLMSYDPGFLNTASCHSRITFIDGDVGILRYRGYPIEQLAEESTYLETTYLIFHGELPTAAELEDWTWNMGHHTLLHENIKKFIDGFKYDAHPMGMLVSSIAALSTFYPDAKKIFDPESQRAQIFRLMGKIPTLAAFVYRHKHGTSLRLPGQRPQLHRQLPQHALQDDRAEVLAESGAGEGVGRALHPARGPRAELQHQRHAQRRQLPDRSVLRPGRRRRRALRSASRRRQRDGAAHAGGDRLQGQRPGLHQAV